MADAARSGVTPTDELLLTRLATVDEPTTGADERRWPDSRRRWVVVRDPDTLTALTTIVGTPTAAVAVILVAAPGAGDDTIASAARLAAAVAADWPATVTALSVPEGARVGDLVRSPAGSAAAAVVMVEARPGPGPDDAELADDPPAPTAADTMRMVTFFDRYGTTAERGPDGPLHFGAGVGVAVEGFVAADPATLWAIVTDLDTVTSFSSEARGASWDGAERGVGARFTGRNHHPALGDWEIPCYVARYDVDRTFGWVTVDLDDPGAAWTFDLAAHGGGTLLRYHFRIGPGPSGVTMALAANPGKEPRVLRRRLDEVAANMASTLAGITAIAEQRAGGGTSDEPATAELDPHDPTTS